jgi:hypothetical protein
MIQDSSVQKVGIKIGESYKIKKVSIYGCARYNNKWKGIRIVKE